MKMYYGNININKRKRIMELNEFIANFADQFDDTDASEIQANTEFHEIDEWGSLTGMGVIAMVKTVYDKTITGKEIRECVTVEDLFNLVASK